MKIVLQRIKWSTYTAWIKIIEKVQNFTWHLNLVFISFKHLHKLANYWQCILYIFTDDSSESLEMVALLDLRVLNLSAKDVDFCIIPRLKMANLTVSTNALSMQVFFHQKKHHETIPCKLSYLMFCLINLHYLPIYQLREYVEN